jgi:hypothetical protein
MLKWHGRLSCLLRIGWLARFSSTQQHSAYAHIPPPPRGGAAIALLHLQYVSWQRRLRSCGRS